MTREPAFESHGCSPMARRKRILPDQREELNALPVAAPDVNEEDHFYTCEACGQRVDMRRLGDVFHHEDEGHEPIVEADRGWVPKFVEPLLPTLVDTPPPGDDWSHEIKYDGYRTQVHIKDGEGRAFTRNGHDWSDRYKPLLDAAKTLPCESAVIDGEVIIQGEGGKCDFHGLRAAIKNEPHRLVLMAFDLIELDGQDLRRKPVERRRELLAKLLGPNMPDMPIQFSADVVGDGMGLFMVVDDMGLEGIISKKLGSRYVSGRSTNWLKVKCYTEMELVVVGTEKGDAAPVALLAREDEDGTLHYMGGAMITLRQKERDQFWEAVEALRVTKPPLDIAKRKDATWLRPEMRVRVRTLRGEEKLRHATIRDIVHMPQQQG